jgi:hypothetical protein
MTIRFCVPEAERVAARVARIDALTLEPSSSPEAESREDIAPTTGVHPVVIKVALSAVAWFLAVTWLNFSGAPEVDLQLAVVSGFFVVFFTLLLTAVSMAVKDRRWQLPKASFRTLLGDSIPIDLGVQRGQEVFIQIATLPVSLAGAATLIGYIWSMVRAG